MPLKHASSLLCGWLALLAMAASSGSAAGPHKPPTLLFTGDILLAGTVGKAIAREGPAAPFSKVARLLRRADLAVGNLECALSTRGEPADKTYTFRGRPEAVAALRAAGFDVVTLANNHSCDYGPEALLDTLQACRRSGIKPVGAGANSAEARRPLFVRVGRPPLTIAILAFSNMLPKEFYAGAARPGTNAALIERIQKEVAAARSQADIVIALFHWGTELSQTPSANQRALAHTAADAGADLVVGHHPHVLQGIEVRGNCAIAYSLGNFVFPSRSRKTQQTMILSYTPEARGKARMQVIPCVIEGFRPRPATRKERGAMLQRIGALCARLGTTLSPEGRITLDRPDGGR